MEYSFQALIKNVHFFANN